MKKMSIKKLKKYVTEENFKPSHVDSVRITNVVRLDDGRFARADSNRNIWISNSYYFNNFAGFNSLGEIVETIKF